MSKVFIAWGNIHQEYPLHLLPPLIDSNTEVTTVKKRERQIADFLLWQLLQQIDREDVYLTGMGRADNGRPFLLNTEFDFNLSHSGDWVAVVLLKRTTADEVVGIDIEHPKKARNFSRLLRYYAQPAELAWWQKHYDQHGAFYLSWCAREAILKATGRGIGALSKVVFAVDRHQFLTKEAPEGTLLFAQSLPFYLACFVEKYQSTKIQYYGWGGEKLSSAKMILTTYPVTHQE
ncbi:4'-phosphopantetheinyl transferase family protein [Gallibacterium salpingitidis]|uniref:4'-phosphopantetheinyl transferase family protein n=1 Tax=Gallibacterium salpingitidis TaxID=505341 RepID=UPI0009F62CF7|nr:4'-phosphopantetheinyl transferase superfamily protein [Gallibacterium salpingitidis]